MIHFPQKNFPTFFALVFFMVPALVFGQLTDITRVAIHDAGSHLEMENGYLGVRIPKPSLFNASLPNLVPAPISAVIYKDGTFSSDFPNYLTSPTPPLTMSVDILYETTDSCAIKVSYTFDKPALTLITPPEPAGPGYYFVTFRMVKGEKICCVTEESDYEINYDLNVSNGLSPDKGRYIGHHANTVADGYDVWNNVYVKNDTVGYQATVDLSFGQRKEYPLTSRWNPFAVNSGWHWQLYNSTDPPTANTIGIFDGHTSKLLGVEASGVGVYTEPSGMEDMHSTCDVDGDCHFVWVTEGQLWYKEIDETGASAMEEPVATGLINPFIFSNGTSVNILAIDPLAAAGDQMILLKKTGAGSFVAHTLDIDATWDEPFLYGASDGVHDFILFEGVHNMQGGLLLYEADLDDTEFSYADRLADGSAFRGSNRPDMKRTSGDDILVTYTRGISYQSFSLIANGTTTFLPPLPNNPPFDNSAITFGMNADLRTGDFFWVRNDGSLTYVDLDGATVVNSYTTTGLGAEVDHGSYDKPNRRSMATDPANNALVFHEGYSYSFFYFDFSTKTWSKLDNATWNGIKPAVVFYNTSLGKFYIVGKYQGKLTRFSYDTTNGLVWVEDFPSTKLNTAGFRSIHKRVAPTGRYHPDIRFEWCIYADQKANLPAANVVQPIAVTMNRISGLATKLYAYENDPLVFDPSFENGGLYITPADLQVIIQKVKTDLAFYNQMVAIDPTFKDVLDAWRDPTSAKTDELYNKITNWTTGLKDALTNGDGTNSFHYLYTTAANLMRRYSDQISAMMADTKLTTPQRASMKKAVALFARILWDDDFVPLFVEHGLSLGTPNMVQVYTAQRWYFALILHGDPEFEARALEVPSKLEEILATQLNADGVASGTPHYLQPPMDLVAFAGLQMRNAGVEDIFQSDNRLRLFSDFILHLLTPPSVRFSAGTKRKLIVFGDGTEESAAIFGLMGTGFADIDPALSKRLMYAYRNGAARGSDYGFVTMAVNHNLPDTSFLDIGNAHFPGYLSGFRAGVGTNHETSTMFINGDWYSDHRNDDRGTLSIYALGAPLSLNYGSFYQPSVRGAHMKSTPVLLSQFPDWNNTSWQPFELPNNTSWNSSHHNTFIAFKNSGYSSATFTRTETWTRKVYQFAPKDQIPIIIVKDAFSNPSTDYVYNFNFMAGGTVQTPNGAVTPPYKLWNQQSGPTQDPAASSTFNMAAGMRKFNFTGTTWQAHPAGGIDWEVYMPSDAANDATLTDWAHTFILNTESDEYEATNSNNPFLERQTILRVKGKEGFVTIIIPYFKGQKPTGLTVTRTGSTYFVNATDFDFETNLDYYTFQGGGKTLLTTFTDQFLSYGGASIEDGPMELEIRTDTVVARLHGHTGPREVSLPAGNWTPSRLTPEASYSAVTGKWTLNHTFTDSLQNSFSGGYTEYIFVKSVKVSPKVFLQGPYNTGTSLMNDNLRSGSYLPLTEPYSGLNFTQRNSGGKETTWQAVLDVTGNDAIVDWVFVELRDKNAPGTVLATRCALVQRDGDVVDTDGTSPVNFHSMPADDYYVAVRHRNHLGCRTASAFSLSSSSTVIDFTDPNLPMHGTNARKLIGSVMCIYAGNANFDNQINAVDKNLHWKPQNGQPFLYNISTADFNLDNAVNAVDLNLFWKGNNSVIEQLD
ncbi:MAG: hypothetical protein R2830_12205 [Saprospiraceae bacterium]